MASNQTPEEPGYPKVSPPGGSSKQPPTQRRPLAGQGLPINPPVKGHTSGHSGSKKGKEVSRGNEQADYTDPFNQHGPDFRTGQLNAPNNSQKAPLPDGYYAPSPSSHDSRDYNPRPSQPPAQAFPQEEATGSSRWPSIPCPCGGKKAMSELKRSHQMELDRRDVEKSRLKVDRDQERGEQLQKISSLKSRIQGLQLVIREAQLAGIQQSSQAAWASEDESRLAETLGDLNINISRWVGKYRGGVLRSLGDKGETEILDSWAAVTDLVRYGLPNWLFDPAEPASERILTAILAALISRDLFMKTFGDPFFFLSSDAANNKQGEGQSTATKIENKRDASHVLVDRILKSGTSSFPGGPLRKGALELTLQPASPKEAHQWRAQAFRFLFPKASEAQPGVLNETLSSLELASASLAKTFVESPARHLMRALDQDMDKSECINSLKDLFYCAGELSITIQRCLPEIRVIDPKELIAQPFSVYEKSTEAHRAYGLIDDDDERWEGEAISLVMNPTIFLFGNDDGEGYGTGRVLLRSCVMLNGWA
ncbi:hypothetical protein ACJZ2D_013407 [Fusarium nematophilum]